MAYYKYGGAKKGIKLSLTMSDNSVTTRTYSGLNFTDDTSAERPIRGSTTNEAMAFFTTAIINLTNVTTNHVYSVLEQEYTNQ